MCRFLPRGLKNSSEQKRGLTDKEIRAIVMLASSDHPLQVIIVQNVKPIHPTVGGEIPRACCSRAVSGKNVLFFMLDLGLCSPFPSFVLIFQVSRIILCATLHAFVLLPSLIVVPLPDFFHLCLVNSPFLVQLSACAPLFICQFVLFCGVPLFLRLSQNLFCFQCLLCLALFVLSS